MVVGRRTEVYSASVSELPSSSEVPERRLV